MSRSILFLSLLGTWLSQITIPCRADSSFSKPWSSFAVAAMTLDDAESKVALLEARTTLGATMAIGGALALVEANDRFQEAQLRLHATIAVDPQEWTLESRNLISLGTQSPARYRSRLRVVTPDLSAKMKLSIRAFDELYVDLEHFQIIRNNVAAGFGLELGRRSTVEFYHVWSGESTGDSSNYVLAIFTLRTTR